jgi:DNA replication protein DnaD
VEGWVSIYRELTEGWLWEDKPFSKGQAWIDLIILANYKDNKVPISDEIILVKRGSFITSEVKLMERWGWSKTKVRSFLVQLMNDKKIMKITDRKKTTITLVNYDVYQINETNKEPIKDQKRTNERPIKDTTNKEINNESIIPISIGEISDPELLKKLKEREQRAREFMSKQHGKSTEPANKKDMYDELDRQLHEG